MPALAGVAPLVEFAAPASLVAVEISSVDEGDESVTLCDAG
jgi:hypothetical protein